MEIRLLKYFLIVAEEGSITRAADILHVTQPTLSKQLTVLEDSVGKTLLNRGKRRITLTEEGKYFFPRAQEIVMLSDRLDKEIRDGWNEISGDVYIGSGETESVRKIVQTICKITTEHPSVHFHMRSGNAQDIVEKIDRGILDFGILLQEPDRGIYKTIRIPGEDCWGVLMLKRSPLAQKRYIDIEDLKGIPLIVPERFIRFREIVDAIPEIDTEDMNIVATYNLPFFSTLMVEEGLGYAIVLSDLVRTAHSTLTYKPLRPRIPRGNLYLIWKNHRPFSRASELFLTLMQKSLDSAE